MRKERNTPRGYNLPMNYLQQLNEQHGKVTRELIARTAPDGAVIGQTEFDHVSWLEAEQAALQEQRENLHEVVTIGASER